MDTVHLESFNSVVAEFDPLRAIRHDLHRNPETAFEEYRTADIVAKHLRSYGLDVHVEIAGTGVVGVLTAGNSTKSIGLRADMDALNMDENNDFDHRSQVAGKMHGCGHDGHTVMLLAAAQQLSREPNFDGTVYFIFQPAEENEGGGRAMIEDGLFERFPMDAVFGLHNIPGIPLGQFAVRDGAMMAGFDTFDISILGTGGHAAMPHLNHDPLIAAASLVSALQSVVARNVDPMKSAVVSVTTLHAGTSLNVTPDIATLSGTVRFFDVEVQNLVEERIRSLSTQIAAGFGAEAVVNYERRYPPTINSAQESELCAQVLNQTFGASNVNLDPTPMMAAEDFAFMLQEVPGCYIWAGNGDGEGGCMVHNPNYDFNDALIPYGASYWIELVSKFLVPSQ